MEQESISYFHNHCYLAYDVQGHTQVVEETLDLPLYNHAFIRFEPLADNDSEQDQLYHDIAFPFESFLTYTYHLSQQKIVFKRLSQLCTSHKQTQLFPTNQKPSKIVQFNPKIPHFIYELQHFDPLIFKRYFITQQINQRGKYEMLINKDGQFKVQQVDDYVPVIQQGQFPLWGLSLNQPWKLIITKIWAKRLDGYQNIIYTKPFQFVDSFTPCNWRYFNLALEGRSFLSDYAGKLGKTCRILLKTKQDNLQQQILNCGLQSSSLLYQLLQLIEFTQKNKKQYNLHIKSVVPHKWTGSLSIFDKQFDRIFDKLKVPFQLDNHFLINQPDFFNLFASAYITSSKQTFPQFTDTINLTAPRNNKIPFFFQFTVITSGYLIFTIRQSQQNKQRPGSVFIVHRSQSLKIKQVNQYPTQCHYPQVKYMLSRTNQAAIISNLFINSSKNIQKSSQKSKRYSQLQYELVDWDCNRGYNKGDAHPLAITPGHYILRVQTQPSPKITNFNIQYISHQRIQIIPLDFPKGQHQFLKQSLLSIAHKLPSQQLQQGIISFGYGLILVRTHTQMKGSLVITIDSAKLKKEGYALVQEYSSSKRSQLRKGEDQVFLLRKVQDEEIGDYCWPPEAFRFYQSQK